MMMRWPLLGFYADDAVQSLRRKRKQFWITKLERWASV